MMIDYTIFSFSDLKQRINNTSTSTAQPTSKFQTRHYVAPEFRRQGSLQRKACNIILDSQRINSPCPDSQMGVELSTRPESRASVGKPGKLGTVRPESRNGGLAHSTPRPNSQATNKYYPGDSVGNHTFDSVGNQTLDSAIEHSGQWDAASYV